MKVEDNFVQGSDYVREGLSDRLLTGRLKRQVTSQVNNMSSRFTNQSQGEFVTYLPEGQKPFPGTDITQIRGRYQAITTDLVTEIHQKFDLEVSSANQNLGVNLLSFSRIEGGIRLWDQKRYHLNKASDSTHEQIPLPDQVKELRQTLAVLKHINDVTLGESTKGWLEKAREKRAYRLAKRKLEGQLVNLADRVFARMPNSQTVYEERLNTVLYHKIDPGAEITEMSVVAFRNSETDQEEFALKLAFPGQADKYNLISFRRKAGQLVLALGFDVTSRKFVILPEKTSLLTAASDLLEPGAVSTLDNLEVK